MSERLEPHVHLNGSINLDSTQEVFDTVGTILGRYIRRVPDGEPGPRRLWISYQYPVLRSNYYLEKAPAEPGPQYPPVRLRSGIAPSELRFGQLGYAREARLSYSEFVPAREAGRLPRNCRFQVSLPTPYALVLYVAKDSKAAFEVAYEKAMLKELALICDAIPHRDLAVQWDVCREMVEFDGRLGPPPWPDLEEQLRLRFARLGAAVPEGAELGFHLCYGDLDAKHFIEPATLGKAVDLANLISNAVQRPIAWMHMPVPIDRSDDAFFAPLANLRLHAETELFLGLVHLKDGIEGTRRRIDAARKRASSFGVATECGMGRSVAPDDVPELLRIHAAAADYCRKP